MPLRAFLFKGKKGRGLLPLLKVVSHHEDDNLLQELKESVGDGGVGPRRRFGRKVI